MNVSTDVPAAVSCDGCGPVLRHQPGVATPLRQQIFEHVRAVGQAARADVTRALEISPGTVTSLTSDLIAMGLLREVEGRPRETGRGRPPVALEVVADSHHVIGIKVSDTRHSAVMADFAGNIRASASMPARQGRKPTDVLVQEITALQERLLADVSCRGLTVAAIGVGISGMVDHQTGTVPWSPFLRDGNVALADLLSATFGKPVRIDNDANLLTLAELWFGTGREMSDFAMVTVEQGVGMGLVLNNRLFRGSRGMGLELGHTKVQLDGALCRCGQRGCLEAYLADYALAREAATALSGAAPQLENPAVALEALFAQAKAGNQAARMIFRRAGRYLSVALANVVQLFDPELIILAGERMRYDYLYAEEVMREAHALTLNEGRSPCRIATHAWGDQVWAQGAIALALSAVTEDLLGA